MQNQHQNEPHRAPESLGERLHGWRLGFSVDGESIGKAVVCALLLVFFSLLQTTLFTRFRPFGAVPDLILPLTVAVAMVFHEKWGSVFGLISAFVIESLGGSTFTILPILYMLTGYIVGLLSTYSFRDSLAVRVLYTLVTSPVRMLFTLLSLAATIGDFHLITVTADLLLPELCANVFFAFLPHAAAALLLRPFRHERE